LRAFRLRAASAFVRPSSEWTFCTGTSFPPRPLLCSEAAFPCTALNESASTGCLSTTYPFGKGNCDQTLGQRVFPCELACGRSAADLPPSIERHEFRTDCSYIRGPSWLGYCAVRFRGHCAAEPFVERRAVMPLPFPQMHSPNNLTIVKNIPRRGCHAQGAADCVLFVALCSARWWCHLRARMCCHEFFRPTSVIQAAQQRINSDLLCKYRAPTTPPKAP